MKFTFSLSAAQLVTNLLKLPVDQPTTTLSEQPISLEQTVPHDNNNITVLHTRWFC